MDAKAKRLAWQIGLQFKLRKDMIIRLEDQINKAITEAVQLDAKYRAIEFERSHRSGIATKIESGYLWKPKKKPGLK